MEITDKEKEELETIYQSFLHDERILKMKDIPMHRGSNCYIHSFRVTKLAIKNALKKDNVDLKTLLLGAILHDYYLYDWRIEKGKSLMHCKNHPDVSINNAIRDFDIPKKVQEIIRRHMWPWNIDLVPNTIEAKLVSAADKRIYWKEVLTSKKHKQKKEQDYLLLISKLFDE